MKEQYSGGYGYGLLGKFERISSLEVIAVDLGGEKRLWRQEAGSKMLWKK